MRRSRAVRIESILREGVAVEKDAARLHYVVPVALHVQQRVHAVLQARVRRAQAALFDHLRARVASRQCPDPKVRLISFSITRTRAVSWDHILYEKKGQHVTYAHELRHRHRVAAFGQYVEQRVVEMAAGRPSRRVTYRYCTVLMRESNESSAIKTIL